MLFPSSEPTRRGTLQGSGGAVRLSGLTVGRGFGPEALGASTGVSSPRGSGVEHLLGKEGVTGSNPVVGSNVRRTSADGLSGGALASGPKVQSSSSGDATMRRASGASPSTAGDGRASRP